MTDHFCLDVTCNIASNVSEKFTTPSHVNSIKSQYTKKFLITRLKSPRKFLTLSIHIILFDKKYVYIGLGREPGGDLGSTRGSGKGCDRRRRRVRAWQLRRTCRSCRRRPGIGGDQIRISRTQSLTEWMELFFRTDNADMTGQRPRMQTVGPKWMFL